MIDRYQTKDMSSIWSEEAKLAVWLEVEVCVSEVLCKQGRVPQESMDAIRRLKSLSTQRVSEIEQETRHDVLSFLTAVEEEIGVHSRYVHQGMTSSDLLDTALALQIKRSTQIVLPVMEELYKALCEKGSEYIDTPSIGRTHGIHAQPTSFGLRFLGFAAELKRNINRFIAAADEASVGTISGAVGSYVELAPEIELQVLQQLGLSPETVPTQVVARDRHAALFYAMASIGAGIERIATEIRHLQRSEVREVAEGFGKKQKGSSAMPHKKNPILSENLCGIARLLRSYVVPALENITLWHERDISHSSVERVIFPDAFHLLHFMLIRASRLVQELVVYPEIVEENLQSTGGIHFSGALLVRLCERGLSRDEAYALVQRLSLSCWDSRSSFYEAVSKDAEVGKYCTESDLREVFDTSRHLKHSKMIEERVLQMKKG